MRARTPGPLTPAQRWVVVALAWATYLTIVWVNQERREDLVAPLGVLPLLATGALLGWRAGLASALLLIPATLWIHAWHGAGDTVAFDARQNALRWAIGIVLATVAGWMAEAVWRERQAARAIARIEERLQEAQQLAHIGSWDFDLVKQVAWWSDEMYRIFGKDRATFEATYTASIDAIHPDDRALVDRLFQEALATGRPYEAEHRVLRSDGSVRWVHESCEFFFAPDGRPIRAVGTSQDITERKEAEAALAARDERFELVARATRDVIWDLEVATGRLTWGGSMKEAFGYSLDELAPDLTSWEDRVHPDDRARAVGSFTASIEGTDSQWSDEYRFRRHDGSYADVLDRGFIIRDDAGRPVRVVGAMADMTERRRVAAQEREAEVLRQQAQFKTQFLNTAAHELATPMTPLKLQLASLRARAEGLSNRERDALDLLERNVNRMGVLVNDLLDAARLQSGQIRLTLAPLRVDEVAAQVCKSLAEQASRKGVRLDCQPYAEGVVLGDETRLTQVLFNLVHNAIKFTPAGGKVEVLLHGDESHVVVAVRDTGIGLGEGQAARLFQPFTQVFDGTSLRAEGTGLGLYISKGIVERHGGVLEVSSPGLGQGSTFTVRLPRRLSSAPPTA